MQGSKNEGNGDISAARDARQRQGSLALEDTTSLSGGSSQDEANPTRERSTHRSSKGRPVLPHKDDSVDAGLDLKKRNRALKTQRQRELRAQERATTAALAHQVTALRLRLDEIKLYSTTQSALLWDQMARALLEAKEDACVENRTLRRQAQQWRALVHTMAAWVHTMTTSTLLVRVPPLPRRSVHGLQRHAPHATVSTWRDVTLLAHPASRQLGKAWITEHMMRNKDAMFARYPFPKDTPYSFSIDVDDLDDPATMTYIVRSQFECALPWAQCAKQQCTILGATLTQATTSFQPVLVPSHNLVCDDDAYVAAAVLLPTLQEETETTNLHRVVSAHGDVIHLLCGRHINDKDGGGVAVLVARQVHHDERWDTSESQRDCMAWIEVTARSPTHSCVRMLYRTTPRWTRARGLASLDDEAALWGCDLQGMRHDAGKATRFRAHVTDHTAAWMATAEAR
ncbi:Aste57867_14227 [Aphanomyces stellatus]|uniref:Aste57867_14227 protein n=1 Tax=Aphanomyces stellatus TaxID=120398 RepID=A0A485L0Z5_9STRA|nr:hypothetical protein As57867_014176 [Aphanomyces stellatus]VFT91052.1 Aste57867_14227 [Aphanomyces stellatus]